jgi:hypothetical protein
MTFWSSFHAADERPCHLPAQRYALYQAHYRQQHRAGDARLDRRVIKTTTAKDGASALTQQQQQQHAARNIHWAGWRNQTTPCKSVNRLGTGLLKRTCSYVGRAAMAAVAAACRGQKIRDNECGRDQKARKLLAIWHEVCRKGAARRSARNFVPLEASKQSALASSRRNRPHVRR